MPSPGGARKQAGQELHQSGEENYIEIDMNPRLQQERRSHARENGNSHKLELPHHHAAGRKDQAWAGATDLQYNLQVQVADTSYYLHKFPLMSRSGRLNRLVFESRDTEKDHIMLHDIPGGSEAFEMAARFLYGVKLEITPYNVAILRCAAEYLEMIDSLAGGGRDHGSSSSSNLVTKAENYLNSLVMQGSWQDSICVLQSCSSRPELKPWAEELEIVRRCSESVAWKACTDPHGIRWSFSSSKTTAAAQEHHHAVAARDWWFSDVSTLSIDVFSKVISAVNLKGMHYTMVASAVVYYAEKWLPGMLLTSEASTMSTTKTISRRKAEKQGGSHQGSHQQQQLALPNFTAELKDESKMKLKNRATLQGIVNIIPPQQDAVSCSFLLQLLRVACMVNAGALCKTDLERRIGMQLDTVSLADLLIPAYGNDTLYDTDVVQHILDHYLHEQSLAMSPPVSPAGSVMSQSSITNGSSLTRASSSKSGSSITTRSGSIASSTTTGTSSSTTTGTSSSGASISGSSSSSTTGTGNSSNASISGASSNTGRTSMSSSCRDSSNLSSRSSFSSIVSSSSGSSSSTSTTMSSNNLTQSDSAVTSSSSSRSSISSMSSEESVKPPAAAEKPGFYITEGPVRKPQYPPTIPNLKVAQLIESYLDEVAKDSNLSVAKFMTLTESFSELPRDSDDCLYRAIDSYLKAHPTLIEQERKKLCRIVDCQQLSLDACMHAASNERLPLRVIVQVLFSEQVKLRNAITGTAVVNELDLSSSSSSGHSPSSTSLSDSSAATSTSGTATTSGSSNSTNTVSATTVGSISSVVSSLLPGGLSLKESVKLAMLEIETLRKTALEVKALQKAVLEVETLKTGLSSLEILQHNIETITTKFAELAHDYTETTHQVEELTKVVAKHSSKSSGWSSGWKKIAKPFHHKDHHDHHPYKDYSAGLLINKELAEHQKQAAAQFVHQLKISPPIVITPEVPPRQQIELLNETQEIVKEVPAKEATELLNEQLADTVSNQKETPPFKDTSLSSNQQQKGHPVETANNDHHKGHHHHHGEKKHMTTLDHGHHKGLHQHQEEDADDVALSSTNSHFKDGDSVSTSSSYKENHHHHNRRRRHHKERSSGNSSHGLNHPHKDHHHHLHSDHHKDQPSSTTSHHSNHKAHLHNHKEGSEHYSSQHHHDHHHYDTDHDSTVSTQSSHREGSHNHAHHHNKKHHHHHQDTSEHHHSHHQKDRSDHHQHDHREQQISNRSHHKDHHSKERSSSPIAHSSSHHHHRDQQQNYHHKGRSDHHHHRDQQQNHHHKKHHQHNRKDSDSVSTTSTNSSSQNHNSSGHRHRQYS